jgi:hypothetical protein
MTHEPGKHVHGNSDAEPGWIGRQAPLVIGLLAAELVCVFFHPFFDEHHPAHFGIENVFGYQAVIGFVAFVGVVFLGKLLRLFVQRPEDYYDR